MWRFHFDPSDHIWTHLGWSQCPAWSLKTPIWIKWTKTGILFGLFQTQWGGLKTLGSDWVCFGPSLGPLDLGMLTVVCWPKCRSKFSACRQQLCMATSCWRTHQEVKGWSFSVQHNMCYGYCQLALQQQRTSFAAAANVLGSTRFCVWS